MSSVPRRTLNLRSYKKYTPLFLILITSFLLFLGSIVLLSKNQLVAYCQEDVTSHLNSYLKERASGVLVTGDKVGGLHGLTFVRLIGENEQFLYSDSPNFKADFQGIIDLDPKSSAAWISLTNIEEKGYWVVTSKELANGHLVQAGIEYRYIVLLYENLVHIAFVLAGLSFPVAGGLTYYCRKKSITSMETVEKSLSQILTKKGSGLLQNSTNDELTRLYQLLNQLISQNRQLIKEMQESLDNVAHDLRTPMTRLRSIAEYGLQQNNPEKQAEALSDCLEESERVSSMLGIMMSVVEAESGTMQLKKENVQLYGMIADVVTLYEYVADEKNIHLQMNIDPDITIEADKTRITQVWANIVDNAIKYGKNGGYVKITAQCTQHVISIVFEDNGMGISASEIDRIWERLFRGDRSRSQQGLGLGLNYVRAVIEAHGGEVVVTSTLGTGSLFEIRLFRESYIKV